MKNVKIWGALVLLVACAALPALSEGQMDRPSPRSAAVPRVVTGGRAHTLILNALYMFPEASQAVVAFGASGQVGGHFVFLLDPAAEQRAVLAPEPGVEEILARRPDRVVLKSHLRTGLGRQLEDLGVPMLYLDLETPEQYREDIRSMGKLFGNPVRAEELERYFAENLLRIQNLSAAVPRENQPDTLLLYYRAQGGTVSFNVPPAGWLQTSMVQWAGGRPVWSETAAGSGWQQVSFEQIAAWNPQVILLVSYHSPVDEAKRSLLADPKWMQLEAVRDGKLFAFPADYLSWDQPDPRWVLGLSWLAGKLHPQLVSAAEVQDKVLEFYGFVYGLSPVRIREAILPMIRGDYP